MIELGETSPGVGPLSSQWLPPARLLCRWGSALSGGKIFRQRLPVAVFGIDRLGLHDQLRDVAREWSVLMPGA